MKIHWDKINKWLSINNLTFMFDDWCGWFNFQCPTMREWTLFQIMWDNGSWWASDLNNIEKIQIPHMNGRLIENDEYTKRTGDLNCFFQIKIIGFGIRFNYKRGMIVFMQNTYKD